MAGIMGEAGLLIRASTLAAWLPAVEASILAASPLAAQAHTGLLEAPLAEAGKVAVPLPKDEGTHVGVGKQTDRPLNAPGPPST